MRRFSVLLKCIGVVLFLGIILKVDLEGVGMYYKAADRILLLYGILALLGVFAMKTVRWHALVHAAARQTQRPLMVSWREFMIGVFLSTFTPAKIGDFGKIAYLKRENIGGTTGAILVIIERLSDAVVLLFAGFLGAAVIFGLEGVMLAALCMLLGTLLLRLTAHTSERVRSAVRYMLEHHALRNILVTTILAWAMHYLWAMLLARALGITLPVPVLITAFTGASVLNALPISPSGLGTREAALLAMLLPYGLEAERIVALSTMMLLQLLIVAILGGWYWMRGVKKSIHDLSTL